MKEKRSKWIQIRVSDKEKEEIEKRAKKSNKKVSDYVRSLALKPVVRSKRAITR